MLAEKQEHRGETKVGVLMEILSYFSFLISLSGVAAFILT